MDDAERARQEAQRREAERREARRREIRGQISERQNRVSTLQGELGELRDRLVKVEEALRKHSRTAASMQTDGYENMQTVSHVRSFSEVKLAQLYANAFASVVNGQKNDRALNAMEGINRTLQTEHRRLENEIRARETEVTNLQNRISSLNIQLNSI